MNRNDRWLGVLFFIILLLCLLGLWYGLTPVHAQEQDTASVCRDANDPTQFTFHIPAAWNNPDLANWWYLGDWSSVDQIEVNTPTTIQVGALTTWTDVVGPDNPQWEQDIKNGQAIVGSGDYATILVGDEKTAVCGGVATITPPTAQNTANGQVERISATPEPIVDTNRTCIVQYPQIVVVCNETNISN